MKCSVVNCGKSNKGKASNCSFFRFPTDSAIRKKWISFCGRKEFNPNTSFVCMHHFKAEDFGNNLEYEMGFATKRLLKDGVIPTINIADKNHKVHEERARGLVRKENKKTVDSLIQNNRSDLVTSQSNILYSKGNIYTANNTDVVMENSEEMERDQPQKRCDEIPPSDAINFSHLNQKVETLEKKILEMKKEKETNDEELKIMKEKIQTIEPIHKYEEDPTEICLARAIYKLPFVEEKPQVNFTEGQIKKPNDEAQPILLYVVRPLYNN